MAAVARAHRIILSVFLLLLLLFVIVILIVILILLLLAPAFRPAAPSRPNGGTPKSAIEGFRSPSPPRGEGLGVRGRIPARSASKGFRSPSPPRGEGLGVRGAHTSPQREQGISAPLAPTGRGVRGEGASALIPPLAKGGFGGVGGALKQPLRS